MKRQRVILPLMVLTLCAITLFQVHWVWSSYLRERHFLGRQLSMLFRETVMEAHFPKGMLEMRSPGWKKESGMAFVVKSLETDSLSAFQDSLKRKDLSYTTVIASTEGPFQGLPGAGGISAGPHLPFHTDSLLFKHAGLPVKPLSMDTLVIVFRSKLKEENLPVEIELHTSVSADSLHLERFEMATQPMITDFKGPQLAAVSFSGYSRLLFTRILPQIGVSLAIICLSLFSFLTLYKNLRKQERISRQQRQLISNLSHELKTPIATVSVALEALRNFHQINNPEKTREYLHISQQELSRLSRLTDQVLKLSLLEEGELKIQVESCDLLNLARQSVEAMLPVAEQKGGAITFEAAAGNYQLQADALHLGSALINLLDNAVKYSRQAPEVHVKLEDRGVEIALSVSDKGIGIAPEDQAKVFEKFYRVDQGDLHDIKGFGLGLSYVQSIVKKHQGKLSLQSIPGKGSTFHLLLPRRLHG